MEEGEEKERKIRERNGPGFFPQGQTFLAGCAAGCSC
jgi:hypothetical protein